MTDYSKLVEALRLCQFGECGCGKCYYKELKGDWCTEDNHPEFFDCDDKLKLDAAAAIEALQKDLTTLQKCYEIADITVDEVLKQLPKRGEWIDSKERMRPDMCSACGCIYEEVWVMAEIAWNYCANCGADMRAKMDGPIITPCRGCSDDDGYGGCKSKGGCARAKMEVRDGQ